MEVLLPRTNSTMRGDQGGGRVLSGGSFLVLRARPSSTCSTPSSTALALHAGVREAERKEGTGLSRLWTHSFLSAEPVPPDVFSSLSHDKRKNIRIVANRSSIPFPFLLLTNCSISFSFREARIDGYFARVASPMSQSERAVSRILELSFYEQKRERENGLKERERGGGHTTRF